MIFEIGIVVILILAGALIVYLYDKVMKTANVNVELAEKLLALIERNKELREHIEELESGSETKE